MARNDQVMTVKEVAQYLKVHVSTVYRLAQSGKLPSFKIGGDWRFNKESVDRWRIEQEQGHHGRSKKVVKGSKDNSRSNKDTWMLIDLHGNRKLFVDVLSGEQKILEEVSG